jgi:hypothetical protein
MADKQNRAAAQQTFRQFAWNLAGTLADKQRQAPKPKSAGAKRT